MVCAAGARGGGPTARAARERSDQAGVWGAPPTLWMMPGSPAKAERQPSARATPQQEASIAGAALTRSRPPRRQAYQMRKSRARATKRRPEAGRPASAPAAEATRTTEEAGCSSAS